jgi:predicted PurR-regulated permease PerM
MKETQIHISTKTLIRFWLVIISLALIVGAIYLARWAVVMILVAFFLALVLNRPVEFFARVLPGHSRGLGALITFLITLVVLGGVVTLIVPIFLEQTINFAKALPETMSSLQEQSRFVTDFVNENGLNEAYDSIVNSVSDSAKNLASSLGNVSVNVVTDLVGWLGNAFLVLVLTVFMLIEGPKWIEKFWRLAYRSQKLRAKHQRVASKMYDVISDFVTSQVIIAAISAVLSGLGVFVLSLCFGAPSSLILPVTAIVFVTTFIPMFGAFIGGTLSFVLMLLYNPWAAIVYVVYSTLYQQVLYNFFSPKIQSRKMNISALMILIALVIGLQVGGVLGALVSIPIAGCVIVLVREYLSNRHGAPKKEIDIDIKSLKK